MEMDFCLYVSNGFNLLSLSISEYFSLITIQEQFQEESNHTHTTFTGGHTTGTNTPFIG